MSKRKLYIAYGSNMNIEQMKRRCPKAVPIGSSNLKNYKLEFRGVANIIESKDSEVPVAIWLITEECERALDRYEGFPRLYRKESVYVNIKGTMSKAMVYVMNKGEINIPSEYYYNTIEEGYEDFKIDKRPLEKAKKESYEDFRINKIPLQIAKIEHIKEKVKKSMKGYLIWKPQDISDVYLGTKEREKAGDEKEIIKIVEVIELEYEEYMDIINNLWKSQEFLDKYDYLVRTKECLAISIRAKGTKEGIVVMTEGCSYPRYVGIERLMKRTAHNRKLTQIQEEELLEPFSIRAKKGEKITRKEIQIAYEKATNEPTAPTSMYDFLHRHNWYRVVPKSSKNYWMPR